MDNQIDKKCATHTKETLVVSPNNMLTSRQIIVFRSVDSWCQFESGFGGFSPSRPHASFFLKFLDLPLKTKRITHCSIDLGAPSNPPYNDGVWTLFMKGDQ